MVDTSSRPHCLAFNLVSTLSALLHVRHVILFTVDLVSEGVVRASDHFLTHRTMLLGLLEISFADWFVLKEVVRMPQRLIAHVTLHTIRMVIGVIVDNAVPNNLLTTHTALFLTSLEALCTVCLIILCMEFSIQFLSASVATETFLVKDLSKCCASLFSEVPLTVIALF